MRYNELLKSEKKLNFWEMLAVYGIDERFKSKIHGLFCTWHNKNGITALRKIVSSPKARLLCKIQLWTDILLKAETYMQPLGTQQEFENALSQPVTLWRGGNGVYDISKSPAQFVSFTADRRRVATFSEYFGTYAARSAVLMKNDRWWVVELTLPLRDILGYFKSGGDAEVIVKAIDAERARLIETHEGPVK